MKKWTYLVAAGILLGATPVFTGCIDNDEPEGITVLRGAKAELLKAKASVAAASVEQIKAEAALKLAEAEVKKAEAARIQAIADYEAAKAKEMEYKAELANIQNEEARADLENKIKMYAEQRAAAERAAQAAAAQLEVTLMNLKAQLATQEALYEQALKDLALAKNTLTEAQQKHLQKWTNALDNAQKDVKSKAEKYETAVKLLAELTKTMDKTEAKESYLRTEKKAVEDAKAELDAAIAARDLAKEYAEKEIEAAGKWEEEMLALEADLKALDKKIADLQTERTKVEMATAGEYDEVLKARQAYMDLTGYTWDENLQDFGEINSSKEEIKLNDIAISINEPGLGLSADYTITDSYYYSDYLKALQNGTEFQLSSVTTINNLKEAIKGCALTPNGEAWTAENIILYTSWLENAKVNRDFIKGQWEQAVKAFKGLEFGNPTSFEGFDKVEEVVAIYNEAIKKYNADVEAMNAARDKYENISQEDRDKRQEITDNWTKAQADNQAEYEKTIAEIEKGLGALEKAKDVAYANYDKLKTQYDQIENPTADDAKPYKAAEETYNKADAAYIDAHNKAWGYNKDNGDGTWTWVKGSREKADDLRINKNVIAEKDYYLAIAKQMEEYFKVNPNDVLYSEYIKLNNAIYEYNVGSAHVANAAYQDVRAALSYFNSSFGFSSDYAVIDAAYYYYDEEKQMNIPQEVKAEDVARIDKYDLQDRIYYYSEQLYGYNNGNRLIELTTEEIKKEIEERYMANNPDASFVPYWYYTNMYNSSYGAVGKVEYYTAAIAQGNAALQTETKAKIETLLAEMDAHLAAIDAQFAGYITDVVEPAEKAYTTAYTTLMDKFTKIDADLAEANAQKFAKKPVLDKINAAIAVYLSQEMKPDGTPVKSTTLDDLRAELKGIYDAAVADVYERKTTLIEKKEALQAVIDGTKEPVAAQQEAVAEAQAALEAAQAELKAASEALQAEIERISATDAE